MAKRMIDCELWNDPQLVDDFSADDMYFWLYLLTNPHNNICGVMRIGTSTISRDMKKSKAWAVELLERFSTVHKLIFVDKATSEILILKWWKHNWSTSKDLGSSVKKRLNEIKSETIKLMLLDRIEAKRIEGANRVLTPCKEGLVEQGVDTVLTPCQQDSISISKSNSKDRSTKKRVSTKEQIEDIIKNYSCTEEVKRAIKDYLEMRDSKGAKPTVRAVELMLKRLDKLSGGDDALKADILDQSTMNSWTGLFAFKGDGQKTEPERESAYPVLRFPDEEEE